MSQSKVMAWWILTRPRVLDFIERMACWCGRSGRGAPIFTSPPPCQRCTERDQLRAKFDEESS